MKYRIGIDVGGTFTDFLLTASDSGFAPQMFKVLSTPQDPSVGFIEGLEQMAQSLKMPLAEFTSRVETIVHGTTVTTNAVLTQSGVKTGLITTAGVRDALEMRRGIREEQYNNRYCNVTPLVPRYLRIGVNERMNYRGEVLEPLRIEEVAAAIEIFRKEKVAAVAICFMNSFANAEHEREVAKLLRAKMPELFVTASFELLPSIRFYDRVSTTVLNAYVGPILNRYLDRLDGRLREVGFRGVLHIMGSSGGLMSVETAKHRPAHTLLSGPAAAPQAGVRYAEVHGKESCITVDMGGTSFDASLVEHRVPGVVNEGEINRYRVALPMLDIVTIGAGGGSIGWIDHGGILRMGPKSAGALPGPVCYGQGGGEPTCTDANLVLGYLDKDYFAGGRMKLNLEAAREAIAEKIARPLKLSVEEAAGGMYRVISNNMAQGVREISVKRGVDPREYPLLVAGGAGPLHAGLICQELEIPWFIVPRESSIFCAAGMLLSDLQHDYVSSFISRLSDLDWGSLNRVVNTMIDEGTQQLKGEGIGQDLMRIIVKLDCRYAKQYHEVSCEIDPKWISKRDGQSIANLFHLEHERKFGYRLADGSPIEIINARVRVVGLTEKPKFQEEPFGGSDSLAALKGERAVYLPEANKFRYVPVFDGHKVHHGYRFKGPCLIEQQNTTLLVTSEYQVLADSLGSLVVYRQGMEDKIFQKNIIGGNYGH